MKLYKISAEFEFGADSPLGPHPQNAVLGYDVGKISAVCLVY